MESTQACRHCGGHGHPTDLGASTEKEDEPLHGQTGSVACCTTTTQDPLPRTGTGTPSLSDPEKPYTAGDTPQLSSLLTSVTNHKKMNGSLTQVNNL